MKKLFFVIFILPILFHSAMSAQDGGKAEPVAKNEYVEATLSDAEKAAYYANPVAYVEKLAPENSRRALELSLYYQGWAPEFVFFRFDKRIVPDLLAFPTKSEMRKMPNPPKMRDKQLALKWAKISMEGGHYFVHTLEFCNMAFLLYSENPTPQEITRFGELHNGFDLDIFGDSTFTGSDNYGCGGIYALAFRNGTMGFPRDIYRSDNIIKRSNHMLWRNFYIGFLVPQDRDFAIYILSRSRDFWDMQALADIYKGEFDPKDANKELADYWQKKADDSKKEYIAWLKSPFKRWPHYSGNMGWKLWNDYRNKMEKENPDIPRPEITDSYDKKYNLIKFGAKRQAIKLPYYALSDDIVFAESNPNYDRKRAEKILETILSDPYTEEAFSRMFFQYDMLESLGVDEDLVDKYYKNAQNGSYHANYKVRKAETRQRDESRKVRDIK